MRNTRHLHLLAHFERLMKDRGWRPPTWPEKRVLSETFFFVVTFASGPWGQLCPVLSRLWSMGSVMSSPLSPLVHMVSYVQSSLASGPYGQLCPVLSRLWSMRSVMSSILSPLVRGVSYVQSSFASGLWSQLCL